MAEGFRVDLYALHQAADGISRTVDHVATRPVDAMNADATVIGHDRLADAVADFASRWQLGVETLTESRRQVAARLVEAANAYERSDVAGRATADGIMGSPTGPDPAGP